MPTQLTALRRFSPTRGIVRLCETLTRDYTVISNGMAQNCGLSLAARGLAGYMLSLRDGTDVTIHTLAKICTESQKRIADALNELEDAGYLSRTRIQCEDGSWVTRTVIRNLPGLEDPGLPGVLVRDSEPDDDPWPTEPMVCAEWGEEDDEPIPFDAPDDDAVDAKAPSRPSEVFQEESAPAGEASGYSPELDVNPDAAPDVAVRVVLDVARHEPRLRIGQKDLRDVAGLVADALAAGDTPGALKRALTWDIPDMLRSPAGLLRHRLRERVVIIRESSPPIKAPVAIHVCISCERPSRDGKAFSGGKCAECRE